MCLKHTIFKNPDDFDTVSSYLAYVREIRGYSLQDVVDLIETAVAHQTIQRHCSLSRGYLFNLEAGKYNCPCPIKLQALAHVYNIPYELLLQKAGYWEKTNDKGLQNSTLSLIQRELQEFTSDELQSLIEFIDFVKSKRTKSCKKCQQ